MRETEAAGRMQQNSSGALMRALRLAVVALGIGLVMTAGAARAEDDDGRRQDLRGKDHRQHHGRRRRHQHGKPRHRLSRTLAAGGASQIDLPPPVPPQPRRRLPTGRKTRTKHGARPPLRPEERDKHPREAARILTPSELDVGRTAAAPPAPSADSVQPGSSSGTSPVLSPSQLGFDGGLMNLFRGNKTEAAPFTGEPTREIADPASGRIPDPVAEFCLRHRAKGIAQQGI